mgnify:CR=1 FL=1
MKRRDFIRLGGFLTASVATLGMTGCAIDGEDDEQNLFPTTPEPVRPMPTAATGANWQFPQSVASADPRPDSIILWTRVVATGLAATDNGNADVAIRLVVTAADNSGNLGTDTALTGTLVADVMVPSYIDFDNSIRHKLSGLNANAVYFYQFIAGDVRSKVGRFKTAPAVSYTGEVKFIFMSCQSRNDNHWGAFSQIVADDTTPANPDVDFIVHLGDYIYETDDNGAAPAELAKAMGISLPDGAALPGGGEYAASLNDYRYLYKLYRSDSRLQSVHERFPIVAVWDDHEFSDDAWLASETYTNANVAQPTRRRNANQAWFEFMPADVSFSEGNPGFQNIRLYRDLKFGATVHLVMTDERLYRQDHLIPENTKNPLAACAELGRINSRYLAPEVSMKSAEILKDEPSRDLVLITMLGGDQRRWWKDTMSASTATWKVWGNEVSLLRMGLNGTKAVGTLLALQVISDAPTNMTNALSNPSIQGIPKAVAGAGAAIGAGASSAVAVPAAFAMLATLAGGGDATAAIAAGEAAGLTNAQATAAVTAIAAKTPTAAEVGICATTVVAATSLFMTTNMAQATAQTTAAGVTAGLFLTDAATGGNAAAMLNAAKAGVLGDAAGTIIVNVYNGAKAAAGSGQAAQVGAGATAFATGGVALTLIRTEVETFHLSSSFIAASGLAATLGPFLQKFIINADQWDGYRKERTELMNHLISNGIQNVVAVTGDIHAFFAGTVYNRFEGEVTSIEEVSTIPNPCVPGQNFTIYREATTATAGTPAMVDLVTAGVSSTSWFNYLSAAAASLNALLTTLVSATVPAADTGLPFDVTLPVLDFSLGKPFSGAALTTMARDAVKRAAAANGVPESALGGDANITATIAPAIAGSSKLQGLCAALAAMGTATNPWLAHIDSNAQGYAVVTANSSTLSCEFKRLNAMFVSGGNGYAPGLLGGATDSRPVVDRSVVATVTAGSTAVVMS